MRALPLLLLALAGTATADEIVIESPSEGGGDQGEVGTFDPERESRETAPIINGQAATREDWPMTGAMMMEATWEGGWHTAHFRMMVCSSTLIAPDVVLLAAHCVDENSFTYGYGTLEGMDIRWSRMADLTDHDGSQISDWPPDAVAAWDWVYHPQWDLWGLDMGIGNSKDIALLFLETPVLDVPYAYVVTAEESSQIAEGNEVVVVGWGQQTSDSSPPSGTYATKQMGTSYISELGQYEFQVGLEPSDVRKCHGDSGGPSFMSIETETVEPYRLVGVTSHAYDQSDCRITGGVDTRVDAYLDWLDSEMRSRCQDGTRAWCDEEGLPEAPMPEPIDTGDTSDTGAGNGGEDGEGCGCSTGQRAPTGAALGLMGLLAGLALKRRRD